MSANSSIEWTDQTWNPMTGCTKVSPGCDHCYAKTMHERFNGPGSFDTITLHPDRLTLPLRWRKPRRVFVNSMSDLFHQDVPDEFIAQTFAVMALAPQHTFQVLTKRHARMRSLLSSATFWQSVGPHMSELVGAPTQIDKARALPNVWLGVSVENQQWADIRIPALLDTPAAVRFLSCEPLLGPVDLRGPIRPHSETVDWVIVGGESGPGARPMHQDWARSLRDQCVGAGVPFLFKQWGAWTTNRVNVPNGRKPGAYASWHPDGLAHPAVILDKPDWSVSSGWTDVYRVGKHAAGRLLDGRTWDEYPERAA